jgi:cystathionine beta-lyase/cystathionine gamma-synthase
MGSTSFAKYVGTTYAVATNSGTSALHLALLTSGVKEGDEVITTPFSFIASAKAILCCDAKPVFVDIDPVSYNINPNLIETKITSKTKAVLGVHLYGQTFDIFQVQDICNSHHNYTVEVEKKEPFKLELSHFLNSITSQTTPLVSGEEGLKTLQIALEACRQVNGVKNV